MIRKEPQLWSCWISYGCYCCCRRYLNSLHLSTLLLCQFFSCLSSRCHRLGKWSHCVNWKIVSTETHRRTLSRSFFFGVLWQPVNAIQINIPVISRREEKPSLRLVFVNANMEIKMLQKSSTFSSLSSGTNHNNNNNKKSSSSSIGSWFDRRARKLSMRCSKSITLGKTSSLACSHTQKRYTKILISYPHSKLPPFFDLTSMMVEVKYCGCCLPPVLFLCSDVRVHTNHAPVGRSYLSVVPFWGCRIYSKVQLLFNLAEQNFYSESGKKNQLAWTTAEVRFVLLEHVNSGWGGSIEKRNIEQGLVEYFTCFILRFLWIYVSNDYFWDCSPGCYSRYNSVLVQKIWPVMMDKLPWFVFQHKVS